jgi:phosphoenolpyruvate phosphomutase
VKALTESLPETGVQLLKRQVPVNKAEYLRALLNMRGSTIVRIAGVHDAIGAKLADSAGFDAIWASGLGVSAACGLPDVGVLSMPQLLQACVNMDDATSRPVIADCDTGFGGTNHTILLAREFGRGRIAGVCIEDKVFPKKNSLQFAGHELENIKTFCSRLTAFRRADSATRPVLIARTEALIANAGLDEALTRASAYVDAGAEAILVHSKRTNGSEVLSFLDRWTGSCPIVAVPTTYPQVSCEVMQAKGLRAVVFANQVLRAYISAAREILNGLVTTDCEASLDSKLAPLSHVFTLIEASNWDL